MFDDIGVDEDRNLVPRVAIDLVHAEMVCHVVGNVVLEHCLQSPVKQTSLTKDIVTNLVSS